MWGRMTGITGPGWFLYPGSKLEQVAVHEAAHAVVAELYGMEVESVTITPSKQYRGQCQLRKSPGSPALFRSTQLHADETREEALEFCDRRVRGFLAGPIAQTRVSPAPISWGSDRPRAAMLTQWIRGLEWRGIRRYLRQQEIEVVEVLKAPEVWRAVAALARELQFRGSIHFRPGQRLVEPRISESDWLISKPKQEERFDGRIEAPRGWSPADRSSRHADQVEAEQRPDHESAPRTSWGHVDEARAQAG